MGEASSLVQLGFSEHFRAAYENHPAAGSDTRPGRVCIEHRGRLVVLTGGERLLAWPPEGARHESLNPEEQEHPEDNWVWSPQGVINMHLPDRWGEVVFE